MQDLKDKFTLTAPAWILAALLVGGSGGSVFALIGGPSGIGEDEVDAKIIAAEKRICDRLDRLESKLKDRHELVSNQQDVQFRTLFALASRMDERLDLFFEKQHGH